MHTNRLSNPVYTTALRLNPVSDNSTIALGLDIVGCLTEDEPGRYMDSRIDPRELPFHWHFS